MKLKNKILIILIALISCLLLNATNCFAATNFTFNDGEKTVELNLNDSFDSVSEHIVILKNSDSSDYLIYFSDTEIYLNYDGSMLKLTTNSRIHRYSYSSLQNSNTELSGIGLPSDSAMISAWSFLTANKTTYTSEAHEEVFFQLTPQENLILAPIVEEVETQEIMSQILTVLPIVIVVIVGLIAMRKAIKELLNLLKRS